MQTVGGACRAEVIEREADDAPEVATGPADEKGEKRYEDVA